MNGWPRVTLHSVLSALETGKRPQGGAVESGIPSLGGEHVNADGSVKTAVSKYVPEEFFNQLKNGHLLDNDILIVKDGATTGKTGLLRFPYEGFRGAANEHVFIVRADQSKCIQMYAYYALRSPTGNRMILSDFRGAAQGGISRGFSEKVIIPLPPLAEQRRIVALLDRAAEIRRRADAARAKARAIIPAFFLDMFGDPATNPKGWPVKMLGELGELDRGRSRHRPRNAPELYGGPYPFVQTGDVANSMGRIRRHEQTYSEAGLAQSKMWPSGTLCITIAANIGKTGILEFDACFPDSVVGFKPRVEVTSEFIQTSLNFMQAEIEARAPQAAQKNINLQVLRGVQMACPPFARQTAFAEQAQRLEAIARTLDAAVAKAEAMAAGLSAEVFGASPQKGNSNAGAQEGQ